MRTHRWFLFLTTLILLLAVPAGAAVAKRPARDGGGGPTYPDTLPASCSATAKPTDTSSGCHASFSVSADRTVQVALSVAPDFSGEIRAAFDNTPVASATFVAGELVSGRTSAAVFVPAGSHVLSVGGRPLTGPAVRAGWGEPISPELCPTRVIPYWVPCPNYIPRPTAALGWENRATLAAGGFGVSVS